MFPDLSQEHYYGIAVSSRKSIVGIEMQMRKPSSPFAAEVPYLLLPLTFELGEA